MCEMNFLISMQSLAGELPLRKITVAISMPVGYLKWEWGAVGGGGRGYSSQACGQCSYKGFSPRRVALGVQ